MTNTSQTPRVCSSSPTVNKMPGVRCPSCASQGQEVWVIPGKSCHVCHTPCG